MLRLIFFYLVSIDIFIQNLQYRTIHFEHEVVNIFVSISFTFVWDAGAHENHVIKTILLSNHNVHFD